MIDVTNLKSPGWQRVVLELTAGAPDDKTFYERLMRVLAQVSAARRASLFIPHRSEGDEVEPREVSTWPEGADTAEVAEGAPTASEMASQVKDAARHAFTSGAARAFAIEKTAGQYYDSAGPQGYILAVPLAIAVAPAPGSAGVAGASATASVQVPAVIVMVIEPRSKEAVRSTLAMGEVLAGYINSHMSKQQLRRTQTASYALDLATRLIAAINTAPNFKGALLQLANDLARQLPADRVAIGWVRGDKVRVESMSDTEHFDRRMAMVQKIQAAMDECLDQEQPILYPQPSAEGPHGDVLLSQSIVHSHRELAAGDSQLKVCSLPLRIDDDIIGIITVEVGGEGRIELGTIELLQSALDLISPVLRIRRSDDRALPVRVADSAVKTAAWAVGPKHTVWKVVGLLLMTAAIFVTFYEKTYHVGAPAVIQPRVKQIVSTPFDGTILRLRDGLEPGLVVSKDDVLVELDTTELLLSRADVRGRMAQAEAAEKAALSKDKDSGAAEKAHTQWVQAEAQLKYIDDRIVRSKIRAPISGTIITGDLTNRVNSTIKLGDPLLEIAKLDDIVAVAQVDDRDIWLVKKAFETGTQTGSIVAKSQPSQPFGAIVERIIPLATAKDGKNTFEVRLRVLNPPEWFSPGMEGLVNIDTQSHSLLWIGTRKVLDAVRLWWW